LFPGLNHLSFRHLSGHEFLPLIGSFIGIRMIAALSNAKPIISGSLPVGLSLA
jgi:hypothetical protein